MLELIVLRHRLFQPLGLEQIGMVISKQHRSCKKNSPRIGKDGFSLRVGIRTSDTELGGFSVRPAVNLDLYKKFGITFSIEGRGPSTKSKNN